MISPLRPPMGEGDDRFCSIALALGFLDEERLVRALDAQGVLERRQPVGQILLARGELTLGQVDEILHLQKIERGEVADPKDQALVEEAIRAKLLGKIAVLRGLVSPAEVEECIFIQRQLAAKGETKKIGEILVEKGYLEASDLSALVELQARAEAQAKRALSPKPDPSEESPPEEATSP